MWTACVLSLFQLLSDDYISYVFFIFFVGVAIGAVQVIAVPFVIEMVWRSAERIDDDDDASPRSSFPPKHERSTDSH